MISFTSLLIIAIALLNVYYVYYVRPYGRR